MRRFLVLFIVFALSALAFTQALAAPAVRSQWDKDTAGELTFYNLAGDNLFHFRSDGLDVEAGKFKVSDVAVTSTAAELNTLDLSAVGAILKVKKLSISATPDGTEQDTGWDLPAKAVIIDVFVDVTTAEATGGTKTLNVGTDGSGSNDPDGFLAAISVASTGLVRGKATITAGVNETYFASTTRGALLASLVAGSDNAGDVGTYYEFYDTTSGGESITFTAGSGDWAEFRGDIYIVYIELG